MKLLSYTQRLFAPVNDGTDGSGGGNGSPAAFDQAAFTATILAEINKGVAAQLKTFKAEIVKQAAAKPAAVAATSNDQDPAIDAVADPAAPTDKAKPDPVQAARLRALEKKNEELQAQFAESNKASAAREAAAELRERQTSIREGLAGLPFGSDAQRDTAFKIFSGDVRRLEDGSLVGGAADLPLKEFIGEQMKQHSYLLAPKDVSGAGARSGGHTPGAKQIDLDSIKPGMSAADFAAVSAEISAALTPGR